MMETISGTVLADLVRHGTGAPPSGPLTTALIGSGASLLMTRGRRPIGLVLLAAGGVLLWREAVAARDASDRTLRPARPGPPAPGRPRFARRAAATASAA